MTIWKPVLFILALIIALPFLNCDCGGSGDDDDDSSNNNVSENCEEERACYIDVTDCISESTTLTQLLACTGEATSCLVAANSCTTEYLSCASECFEGQDVEACVEACVGAYNQCFSGCGWNYNCFDTCSVDMDTCTGECPLLDFDCWQKCFVDGYDVCMQDCF